MKRSHFIMIVIPFLLVGAFASLGKNAYPIWNDFYHSDNYMAAMGAKITKVECTNWNYAMFHECEIFISGSGFSKILYENRFGRYLKTPMILLQDRFNPSIFTTDIGLKTIHNRVIYFLVMNVLGTLFLIFGCIMFIKRRLAKNAEKD